MKKISPDAVRENAKHSIERRKASGEYWQNNVEFNPDLDIANKQEADKLWDLLALGKGYKEAQKRRDFYVLLANLFYYKGQPISISMNMNSYNRNAKGASHFIIELINRFDEANLIDMKPGFKTEKQSRMTRITATDLLLQYCPTFPNAIIVNPRELVILKDKDGKLKDYKDTAKTRQVRKQLKAANEVNALANICYQNEKITAIMKAIYIEKFTWYGRLHTRGYRHAQGLSGNERKKLTINGDPVVELDYKAMHPMLLYASEGIQYEGDPYSVVDDRPEVRNFLKHILLAMINSDGFTQAEKAANFWTFKNMQYDERIELGVTKARPFMERFIRKHKPICHHFFQGKGTGMKIMNKDAAIALDVINHFIRQGIPCLPVHDSFIVQKQYSDELEEVMRNVYQQHSGGFSIEVKGKKPEVFLYLPD